MLANNDILPKAIYLKGCFTLVAEPALPGLTWVTGGTLLVAPRLIALSPQSSSQGQAPDRKLAKTHGRLRAGWTVLLHPQLACFLVFASSPPAEFKRPTCASIGMSFAQILPPLSILSPKSTALRYYCDCPPDCQAPITLLLFVICFPLSHQDEAGWLADLQRTLQLSDSETCYGCLLLH